MTVISLPRALKNSLKRSKRERRLRPLKIKKRARKKVSLLNHTHFYIETESEAENESDKKESKDEKESSSGDQGSNWSDPIKNFFFEPNGGPPKPDRWGLALAAAMGLLFVANYRAPL